MSSLLNIKMPTGFSERPVRSTAIVLYGERTDQGFAAVHFEKVQAGVKSVVRYGETPRAALDAAKEYDDQLQEKFKRWRESAKRRRQRV